MIRWKYAAPRVALLLALGLAYWFGLNPAVRFCLTQAGQFAVQAKVEIGQVDASAAHTEMRLGKVCVADPSAPMTNLFEADEIKLSLETGPLLRKRLVVDAGVVSGLRLGAARQTSGALAKGSPLSGPQIDPKLLKFVRQEAVELTQTLFARFASIVEQEVQKQLEELESPKVAQELLQRWPREFEQLHTRADGLRQRVIVLQRTFEGHPSLVPQDLEKIRQLSVELENLRREAEQLRGDFEQLPPRAEKDRQALLAAAARDQQRLQERFRIEQLNAEQLSQFFLGRELSDRLETAAKWINWGRKILPQRASEEPPLPQRGVEIVGFGVPPGPDFLIRKLSVSGDVQQDGERLLFRALATGVTTQPRKFDEPLVIRAEVSAPSAVRVNCIFDRRGAVPHDRIALECLGLPQPKRTLGQPEQLALVVSPGNTQAAMVLDFQGEQLAGQLVLRQEPVELLPQLGDKYGGARMAATLQGALSQIRNVEAVIDIAGTIEKPNWKFRSNLGGQLTDAFNMMVQNQLRRRRNELETALTARLQSEGGRIAQVFAAQQQSLLEKLKLQQDDSQKLRQAILQRAPGVEQMGRELQTRLPDLKNKLPLRF